MLPYAQGVFVGADPRIRPQSKNQPKRIHNHSKRGGPIIDLPLEDVSWSFPSTRPGARGLVYRFDVNLNRHTI
jgi:hypothetical protein